MTESIEALQRIDIQLDNNYKTLHTATGYLFENDQYLEVVQHTILTDEQLSYSLYKHNNQIIHVDEHHFFYKDTTVQGTVFLPDPITSSNSIYGVLFSDNDDLTSASLNNELFEKTINIRFENDSFRLENEHLIISNHSSPDIIPTVQKHNNFKFNRSQNGFEEINAIYHITKFAEYIKDTLGYSQIVNYQIPVDVYALNNADQSEFINSTSPPQLNFGQGAVDDAEDADILIHEYTHAMSFSMAPNTISGSERKALEEGIGDYFAAVYSKKLNSNNYKTIFNWDGHNEFWIGRSIDNNKHYPEDIENQKYMDGGLFASVLMEIRNKIPDTVADKIILESMFSWYSNMTFENAGELLLEADTALYSGSYSTEILKTLCNRGLIKSNCINNKNEIETVFHMNVIDNQLSINSMEKGVIKVNIYNASGKLIDSNLLKAERTLNINHLTAGVYIVKAQSENKVGTKKIILK